MHGESCLVLGSGGVRSGNRGLGVQGEHFSGMICPAVLKIVGGDEESKLTLTHPKAHNSANSRQPVSCKGRLGQSAWPRPRTDRSAKSADLGGRALRACEDRGRRQGRRPAAQAGRRVVLLAPAGRVGRAKRPSLRTPGAADGPESAARGGERQLASDRGRAKRAPEHIREPHRAGGKSGRGARRRKRRGREGHNLEARRPADRSLDSSAARSLAPGKASKIKVEL